MRGQPRVSNQSLLQGTSLLFYQVFARSSYKPSILLQSSYFQCFGLRLGKQTVYIWEDIFPPNPVFPGCTFAGSGQGENGKKGEQITPYCWMRGDVTSTPNPRVRHSPFRINRTKFTPIPEVAITKNGACCAAPWGKRGADGCPPANPRFTRLRCFVNWQG